MLTSPRAARSFNHYKFTIMVFILAVIILSSQSRAYPFKIGWEYGWNATEIRCCLQSYQSESYEGLKSLYFSNAWMLQSKVCGPGCLEGAVGLYFPGQRRVIIAKNPLFCNILGHELSHLRQENEKRSLWENETEVKMSRLCTEVA